MAKFEILSTKAPEYDPSRTTGDQVEKTSLVVEWSAPPTASNLRRFEALYVNASKTLMIENLAVLFAAGELKFAHDLPLRQEIEEDLGSSGKPFRETVLWYKGAVSERGML